MEVKQGYKQTEIGIIPQEWEVVNISNNSTLKARIGWQGLTTKEYLKTGDIYLVTGTDFENGAIKWDTCHFVEKIRFDQDKNIQIKNDDILVTKDGTIGKVAIIENFKSRATLNSGVFVIRPKNNAYFPKYFYYILRSSFFDVFLSQLAAGSTISHLYQKDFVKFDFPLPPSVSEQKAIAQALSDTDDLITALDALIEKKKVVRYSLMESLISESKIDIKQTFPLGDLCKLLTKQTGFDYTAHIKPKLVKRFEKGVIPFIQNKDFNSKNINFNTDYFIPESVANNFPKILLDEKCLLISISGSIGNVGIFENSQKAFLGGAIAVAKFIDKNQIDWVMYYLQSSKGRKMIFENMKAGSHQNLILDDIRKIQIPLPSVEIQMNITSVLTDMDNEIAQLEKKRDKYKALKQGMMQELLTGKTRLQHE